MNNKPQPSQESATPKANSTRGFTLVELLVVMGISAILIGISLGGFSMVHRMALAAKCTSNLRQVGVGFLGYLGDHDNIMPLRRYGDGTPYYVVLNPYTGGSTNNAADSVFVCPTQTSNDFPNEPSYGMNWYYDNISVASVTSAATTIMAAETYGPTGSGSNRADRNSGDPGELDPKRHNGMANYLFFDGHIEKLPFSTTTASIPDMWGTDYGNHTKQSP